MRLIRNNGFAGVFLLCALNMGAAGCSSSSDGSASEAGGSSGPGETSELPGGQALPSGQTYRQAEIAESVFRTSVSRFELHAFHEEGAEPYVGALGLSFDDTWDISKESFRELFSAHAGRVLTIPATLTEMTSFADQGTQDWAATDLIELGRSLAPELVDGSEVNVAIVFINGLFDGNDSILGVHFGNTPFAFVFKDVVRSVGGDAVTQRYVEQATVVHEIGHTIGFVNNGVPMANDHEDIEHPHHTSNSDGVMYWAVESKAGILTFLTDAITGSKHDLFGSESLLDAQSYMP